MSSLCKKWFFIIVKKITFCQKKLKQTHPLMARLFVGVCQLSFMANFSFLFVGVCLLGFGLAYIMCLDLTIGGILVLVGAWLRIGLEF